MYQIDKTTNSITALSAKGFGALGFNERAHLLEWIAKCPECLGEELLIIAKEFDGFEETRERLDLLALDKQGGLVVIRTSWMTPAGMSCGRRSNMRRIAPHCRSPR